MKLGKNEKKISRSVGTARYKLRQEKKQKESEKFFINILKHSYLDKMGLFLTKKRRTITLGTCFLLIVFVGCWALTTASADEPTGKVGSRTNKVKAIEAQPAPDDGESLVLDSIMAGPEEFVGLSDIKEVAAAKMVAEQNALRVKLQKENELASMVNPVLGYKVLVDGKLVAILGTKAETGILIEGIKNSFFKKDDPNIIFLGFAEKIEFIEKHVEKSSVMTIDEANKMIMYGGQEVKVHVVKSGESIWLIARENNMKVKELAIANPDLDMELVHIGDKLQLVLIKPLISVKTQETVTVNERIPFKEKVENSKSLFKNESKIRAKGEVGQRIITADLIKVNGQVVTKRILTEKIVKQPKTQYLVKGTKAIPSSYGSLAFRMPSSGGINTYFGNRGSLWGIERHRGIDIGGNTGDTVSAADNGKVIKTGYDGRSGNNITINHGRGYLTFYAHLSKIGVSAGQTVAKGQYIGKVGNTGHSTGPHLHFEIRINNVLVNPLKYIR